MTYFLRIKSEIVIIYYTMETQFAQTITQFANLRTCARFRVCINHAQLIRNLFPKAQFDEKNATREYFFEIAWSFLSEPKIKTSPPPYDTYVWSIANRSHRIGGLPAQFDEFDNTYWRVNGELHRNDRDPRTGLILPAVISMSGYIWLQNGQRHRDDRDPRTGLALPAMICNNSVYWYQNDECYRALVY